MRAVHDPQEKGTQKMKWNIYHKGTIDYLGTAHGETETQAIQSFLSLEADTKLKEEDLEARPREEISRGI